MELILRIRAYGKGKKIHDAVNLGGGFDLLDEIKEHLLPGEELPDLGDIYLSCGYDSEASEECFVIPDDLLYEMRECPQFKHKNIADITVSEGWVTQFVKREINVQRRDFTSKDFQKIKKGISFLEKIGYFFLSTRELDLLINERKRKIAEANKIYHINSTMVVDLRALLKSWKDSGFDERWAWRS